MHHVHLEQKKQWKEKFDFRDAPLGQKIDLMEAPKKLLFINKIKSDQGARPFGQKEKINMLSIIVAKAKNNIIGKDNKLLWHIPADLKRFREKTEEHIIIMGRKTFESLGKVLPNRKHIVFTQNPDFKVNDENVEIVHSLLQIQEYIESDEECFVIGGATIYNFLMPYVQKMYVTEINKDFDGDSFFPKINETKWKEISREKGPHDEENNLDYEFIIYEKI